MPKKKKANQLPWILANNPNRDNVCSCFKKTVPDANWVVVKKYETLDDCSKEAGACNELFMKMPIGDKYLRNRMGMGMGMK